MKIHTILYTMKGCDHCRKMKRKLRENRINFIDRDVDKHENEYEDLKKIIHSDYVPIFMIIEESDDLATPYFYVPGQSFKDFDDAIDIIKEHQAKG